MHYFINSFKNYGNFNGRARRSEFWYFHLFYFISIMMASLVARSTNLPLLIGIVWLIFIIPLLTVGVRRMHDVGKSGWFMFIPLYNLVLALTEGDTGDNEYGSDLKEAL